MKEILTAIGSTYAITSKNGCTVTYPNGDPIIEVPAGQQTLFIAQSSSILVSDEEARVTACGGSATLNFTSAAPSILSEGGSTGGLTAEERALLNGAAQRAGDNTFSAANTFTGSVDMSTASVTPPSGWNVGELTPEAIQAVAPIAWDEYTTRPSASNGGLAIGNNVRATGSGSMAIGRTSQTNGIYGLAVGFACQANDTYGTAIGSSSTANNNRAIAMGISCHAYTPLGLTMGASFTESTSSGNVTHTCQTRGTGSITIGAGANTLNNGSTESSNSVTIGCKAENKGADSVVIGAQAKGIKGSVVMGTSATGADSSVCVGSQSEAKGASCVSIGLLAKAHSVYGVALGSYAEAQGGGVAVGYNTKANKTHSVSLGMEAIAGQEKANALGYKASVNDYGATVIRSTAQDGTYTQLYFSGANTPLANTYHGGAPMLGYVTKDSAGNIVAAGTRSLIDLLTENSTFAPASLDENGEWVMPKVFHPSDLDMPTEEPTEPEEYTPLPVWPIVEPEIEEEI